MKETDLYQPVIKLFPGANVYPEVVVRRHRPDIVIKEVKGITVVEMKTSLSLALIEQAYGWVNTCDYIYVAVPVTRRINDFAVRLLRDKGIGVILVSGKRAYVHQLAVKQPHKNIQWDKHLHEFYKQNESGGTNGEYMTPYKNVIQCVKEYLSSQSKPLSIKDIVGEVDNQFDKVVSKHYRNPEGSLRKALSEYETDWCKRSKQGGRIVFSTK